MKGIMFTTLLKLCLVLHLGTYFVYGDGSNGTTTTTTPTSRPVDLSGAETGHYETSVQLLRPGESMSRSKSLSYTRSAPEDYEQRSPSYEKGRYEERGSEYEKDQRQREEFYKGNVEDNYHHQRPQQQLRHQQNDDYGDSYEGPFDQRHRGNEGRSYEESTEKRNSYPDPNHSIKGQDQYGQQDYTKEESYESTKEEDGYGGGRPPYLRYAYEVQSNHQQQASYDPLDVPDRDRKSGYGPTETKVYPPKGNEPEYYPRPDPTRYIPQNIHKGEEYRSDEQKEENYFPAIPKEAGYVSKGQKEPGYLQSPPNEPSYSKQAGYLSRSPEPAAYLPPLPKEKPAGLMDNGKVAVFIKHLGHKTPGSNQYVNKERQGFLLLPVQPQKMEEKLKELKGHYGEDYRQVYQGDKESNYKQGPVIEKEVYIQPKVIKYPVNTKVADVHYGSTYSQDQDYAKPQAKAIISHGSYRSFRPVIRHTAYDDSRYESPKVHAYAGGETSAEGHVPYITKSVGDYEEEREVKPYSGGSLVYRGSHGVIPSFTGAVKYDPAPLYRKAPEYITPYDVTTAHRSVPIKISGLQPSSYGPLSHEVDYSGVSDLASLTNKAKRIPGTSHLYSTQYKNIGARLASAYESPKLEETPKKGKSIAILLHKPTVAFQPSTYSSKGRISAKDLVEDFGLHNYESLLSKPKQGSGVSSLYYDLHSFPAHHSYSQYGLRKSGIKYYS